MERGPVCCGDGGGEEGMTKQGEVDRLQTPASRPRAQEVIHIRKRLPAPRVHAHGSPRLDDPMKEEPPGHTALDRTRRPHTPAAASKRVRQQWLNKDLVTLINLSCLTHVHLFNFEVFFFKFGGALCQTGFWLSH